MSDYFKQNIADGVELVSVKVDRFKANKIAISFALDLDKSTAARNALAISMIANCSRNYPDITAINKKLAYLYGAGLYADVSKNGETQIMTLYITSLDDRFSLGDDVSSQCIDLLLSLVFEPRLDDNGDFYGEDIDREKRMLIEKIESEQNEKRIYALRRTEEIMFENEAYSTNRLGRIEDVEAITSGDIKAALNEMITNAKIQATVIGNANIDSIKSKLVDAFSGAARDYKPLSKPQIVSQAGEVKDVTERMEVKQGKLVLGYRVNVEPSDPKFLAVRAFCDAFGGGPYSKLFANVREKLSLCYYCSARYVRNKSFIVVQCGCEEQNMDKAIEEITNQLNEIKAGDFEESYNGSRIGLSDLLRSQNDDVNAQCIWYANQVAYDDIITPDESAAMHESVTFEQAKECAELLSLDTVYRLVSE